MIRRRFVFASLIAAVLFALLVLPLAPRSTQVYKQLKNDQNYGWSFCLKDGEQLLIKVFRAICEYPSVKNSKVFILLPSGQFVKIKCSLKIKRLFKARLERMVCNVCSEKEFVDNINEIFHCSSDDVVVATEREP